ncbi:hypothetical protein JDPAHGNP_00004 [Escherichia phage S127 BCL3]|uniref:Tail assembly protein n=1 Tax=Escherichia phage vB_EcoM-ECP26 TaxID=2576873 RepID=A0A4Y5TVV8_9CAUD|nr:hypothetical protein ECP26DNA_00061 [Escherichia phage vB_EcoM-ECP26]WEM32683.1 hypothetical protein B9_00081 [Escherichia phage B9-1]WGL32763.1 hypothetical protein JDPAHGNP_00004 [Escherichia phage S127 BCL3]
MFLWERPRYLPDIRLELLADIVTFKSPFTGKTQKVTYATPNWKGTLTVSNISESQLLELKSFVDQVYKDGNIFLIKAYGHSVTSNEPIALGPTGNDDFLKTVGWEPNRDIVRAGDKISVNDELKVVTSSVRSDGVGAAVINISPRLRKPIAAGDTMKIITQSPKGRFHIRDLYKIKQKVDAMQKGDNIVINFFEDF